MAIQGTVLRKSRMESLARYNKLQMLMHWIVAPAIIFLLLTGTFILSEVPNTAPDKLDKLQIHATVGFVVLILTIIRILWALKSEQPAHVDSGSPLMTKLGAIAPKLLNLLALVVALSGLVMGLGTGLIELLVTGHGALPEAFAGPVKIVHGLGSKLLMASVSIHMIASLAHQFVIKDQIFKRILPIG